MKEVFLNLLAKIIWAWINTQGILSKPVKKRQLAGTWDGTVIQYWNNGDYQDKTKVTIDEYKVTICIMETIVGLSGHAIVHFPGEAYNLELRGGFYKDKYLKMHYFSRQYDYQEGYLIFEYGEYANRLEGAFVGIDRRDEKPTCGWGSFSKSK